MTIGFYTLYSLLIFGCSAPEVKPQGPTPSPRDLATLGISSAKASPIEHNEPEKELLVKPADLENKYEPTNLIQYPRKATTVGSSVSLEGPAGKEIMSVTTDLELQVLEKREERYRVICIQCDSSRPYQAGFINKSNVHFTD
jgi:hypothetical protein